MGNENSTLEPLGSLEGSSKGLHITKITKNSAAYNSGLQVYFDFITHLNGKRIESLQDFEITDSLLQLVVYSTKTLQLRNVLLAIPDGKVGIGMKSCDFSTIHERVWHILDVAENSPAFLAGFDSDGADWVIGSRVAELYDKNDFYQLIRDYEGKGLQLWVYSIKTNSIREVVIIPDSKWGGEGLIGCDVGFGQQHRISLCLKTGPARTAPPPVIKENQSHVNTFNHDHFHDNHAGHDYSHVDHAGHNHSHDNNFGHDHAHGDHSGADHHHDTSLSHDQETAPFIENYAQPHTDPGKINKLVEDGRYGQVLVQEPATAIQDHSHEHNLSRQAPKVIYDESAVPKSFSKNLPPTAKIEVAKFVQHSSLGPVTKLEENHHHEHSEKDSSHKH